MVRTYATAVNDRGRVSGYTGAGLQTLIESVGFTQDRSGTSTLLNQFSGDRFSRVSGILENGWSLGTSGSGTVLRPAMWDPQGNVFELRRVTGHDSAQAHGGNNMGQIVGVSGSGNQATPVLWTNRVLSVLPLPAGNVWGSMAAINDDGLMVGHAGSSGFGEGYTIEANGKITPIGTLPLGQQSYLTDVNEGGLAVGYAEIAPGGSWAGIYYRNGRIIPLPRLATIASLELLLGVNRAGQAVGFSYYFAFIPVSRGMVTDGLRLVDLNSVLDPLTGNGWFIEAAYDINDLGQIAGHGISPAGELVGCILTPIPAPPGGSTATPGRPRALPCVPFDQLAQNPTAW